MDCSLSSWAGSALEPCSCIRVAICTCTKHAHPYCQPTTNQLQNGDRPDELSHATFKRCICCLLKACIFCSDWYWTFTLMSCLSISARLSSSCNTTWSHLLRFQVRFKIEFSGAQLWTYRDLLSKESVTHLSKQRVPFAVWILGLLKNLIQLNLQIPVGLTRFLSLQRERQRLKRQSVEMFTVWN